MPQNELCFRTMRRAASGLLLSQPDLKITVQDASDKGQALRLTVEAFVEMSYLGIVSQVAGL